LEPLSLVFVTPTRPSVSGLPRVLHVRSFASARSHQLAHRVTGLDCQCLQVAPITVAEPLTVAAGSSGCCKVCQSSVLATSRISLNHDAGAARYPLLLLQELLLQLLLLQLLLSKHGAPSSTPISARGLHVDCCKLRSMHPSPVLPSSFLPPATSASTIAVHSCCVSCCRPSSKLLGALLQDAVHFHPSLVLCSMVGG
jgi:hypothetical protein